MTSIFISYAHKDTQWRAELESYLRILQLNDPSLSLEVWSDTQLQAGDDWEARINELMERASVALLIVTKNFLASEFIRLKELVYLEQRETVHDLTIFPILAEACPWQTVPLLKRLQHRPADGRPLAAMSDNDQQEQLTAIFHEIVGLVRPSVETSQRPIAVAVANDPLPVSRGGPVLQVAFRHRRAEYYRAEAQYSDAQSSSSNRTLNYSVHLGAIDHSLVQTDPAAYSAVLQQRIFPPGPAEGLLRRSLELAGERQLRLRICIDPTARDLHALRWETLPIAAQPNNPPVAFSRYVSSGEETWPRPVIRAWPAMRILVIDFADPGANRVSLFSSTFSELGFDTTVVSSDSALAEIEAANAPIAMLCVDLAFGPDGISVLWPDRQGGLVQRPVDEAIGWLRRRLTGAQILILDISGAKGHDDSDSAMRVAADIAATGFCAVITTAAKPDTGQWVAFLSHYLTTLKSTGNVDRAGDQARALISDVAERCKPAIFTRLRTGQLWFHPQFVGGDDVPWDLITRRVKRGTVVPILGPGVSEYLLRSREEIARHLADQCQYPLDRSERSNLRKVAQYVATTLEPDAVREQFIGAVKSFASEYYGRTLPDGAASGPIGELLDALWIEFCSRNPRDPYTLLAKMKAPVYLTTAFHDFLSRAVAGNADRSGAARDRILSLDRGILQSEADGNDQEQLIDRDNPLVYHLFGRIDYPKSLILTEDDHFRFLLNFKEQWHSLPGSVIDSFSDSALLFLGFDLDSWDFRAIFRALLELEGSSQLRRIPHVAVQIDPDDDRFADPERTRLYLAEYFRQISERPLVFIGSASDFMKELDNRCKH